MNRILLRESDLTGTDMAVLTDGRAQHLREVLRASAGDTVRIGLINGPIGTATLLDDCDGAARLSCRFGACPPPSTMSLLLALPRPKVMRRLWAPLASMGIRRIVLTNAEKVERRYFDTHWLQQRVFEPLLIEGLQQSGDTRLPEVAVARRLKPLIEDRLSVDFPDHACLLAHPRSEQSLDQLGLHAGQQVLLAVGPEGGWSEYELELLQERGFTPFSMGWRTLRSDTACIALLALVANRVEARNLQ